MVVTSDNPRTEDPRRHPRGDRPGRGSPPGSPASRRERLLAGERGFAVEVDRRAAIALALSAARPGDAVLIAGKGHEDYQIVGAEKRPFDDREEARRGLGAA